MIFTEGEARIYENMMKEIPNFYKKSCGKSDTKFKYTFQDLDCRYCLEYKKCSPICLCPYILDNLPDLQNDGEFAHAVHTVEICETPQKLTLAYLKEITYNLSKEGNNA